MATIYISIEPREFGSYREVLRERLRDHGHEARTRDDLEEEDKVPRLQRIDDAVLKSDVVLCLMGERYGEEPLEKEREARAGERYSYTQWEYLLAKRYGKPVHVFYADDDAPLDVPNDEAKDLTKLQETFLAEEVVAKGVACKAFRDPADLVAQVLQLETSWPREKEIAFQNPYAGLRRFEEKDRDRFFGRDGLIREVLAQVETHRLTALVGRAGAGKSSLVRAGVIPAWRKQHPGGKVIIFQPDRDPFASLAAALTLAGFDGGRVKLGADPSENVFRDLRRGSSRAIDPLGLRAKPATEPWLIFVDQFEEIFTRPGQSLDDQECIRRFVASVEDVVRLNDEGITIVIALRDDFFGNLRVYPDLHPLVDTRLVRVASPDGRELRTIIEAPARTQGVRVEDGLASAMLADMEESSSGLPLLQETLAQLWEAESKTGLAGGGVLKLETYRRIGGVVDCLSNRMERYLQTKGPEEQRTIQNLVLALVGIQSFEGTARVFSRPMLRSELLEKGGRSSQELLRELISQEKVLVAAEEASPFDPTVELAHEALIRGWDKLNRWVAESCEALELRIRITQSARLWERMRSGSGAKGREVKAVLWRGGRLARAMECTRVDPVAKQSEFERIGGLGLLEQDFLKASHLRETRSRRLVRRVALAACVAVLGGSGAWVVTERKALAIREQMRNTDLENRLGAAQTEAALGWLLRAKVARTSPDGGFFAARVLGFEGAGKPEADGREGVFAPLLPPDDWGRAKAAEAMGLIREAPLPFFWSSPGAAEPAAEGRDVAGAAVAWSPDGKWFASGGPDAALVLWSAQGGEAVRKLESHEGPVTCAVFSPDGTLLASGGADKTVRLWKVPSGEAVAACKGHTGWIGAVAFRPDGSQLASGGYDETVRTWEVASGKEVGVRSGDLGFVYSVAFSSDGSLLAAGGEHESVHVWEAQSGALVHTLKGHARSVNVVAFRPDGRLLASGSSDQTVKLWDLPSGTEASTLTGHSGAIGSLAWGRGGHRLASGSADRTIRIWDVAGRKEEAVLTGHAAEVTGLAWDPGSTHLLSGGRAGDLKLWMAPRPGNKETPGPADGSPSRDLVRYLDGGWVQFQAETGELAWQEHADGLPYQEDLVDPESWIGILRSPGEENTKARRLFRSALAARDWNGAVLLARDLSPEQRGEVDELSAAAAAALAEEAKGAISPALARVRVEQGRALVSAHEAWKAFDPDPAAPVDELIATYFKPVEEEPKTPEPPEAGAPAALTPEPGAEMAASGSEGGAEDSPALRAQVIGPPPGPAAPAEPLIHVVQSGDNPFVIAKKYGTTMEKIIEFNQIKDPLRLQIGTELKIPPGADIKPAEEAAAKPAPEPEDPSFTYHTVRAGESPSKIARKYRVFELDLMELNGIEDPSKLQIGARLKIPKTER